MKRLFKSFALATFLLGGLALSNGHELLSNNFNGHEILDALAMSKGTGVGNPG